ncbi:hypothetical protein KAR91_69745 [Candidatus Pacearchaeota archaeon]|nr:hypothetical protein [Candidatus Pacearchaeota archaeon]
MKILGKSNKDPEILEAAVVLTEKDILLLLDMVLQSRKSDIAGKEGFDDLDLEITKLGIYLIEGKY